MYQNYNDYELISLIRENNEEALNIIFDKYDLLIRSLALKVISKYNYIGIDINDLIQEARIAFYKAIMMFNEKSETLFYSYARKCIETSLLNAIKLTTRKKHYILNSSLMYDNFDSEIECFNLKNDAFNDLIKNSFEKNYHIIALNNLTDFEFQVFELKMSGFNYKEIAILLDKNFKSIDNTIQRIRSKLKKAITN